jgi:N-methylhydantoinase B
VKVFKKNVPNNDVLRIIKYNTRFPDLVLGDLNAQIAACKLGLRRLTELLKKYGPKQVQEAIQKTWEMSEQTARKAVRTIPPGQYRAESFLDNDGVELDKPVYIRVKVEVSGDKMIVDFSDINDQVRGSINSGFFGGATNAARIAFKCLTTPHLPANEGCFRPLEVICPPGKLLNARPPAALGDWSVPFPTIIDTIFRALSSAIPERIPAATRGDARGIGFTGFNTVKRKFFSVHVPSIGGHGARPHHDGPAPKCAIQQGDEHMVPVEVNETKCPIIFEKLELCQDSGGGGKFRGGTGVEAVAYLLTDGLLRNKMIRSRCLPWGVHGGREGTGNIAYVIKPDGTTEQLPRVDNYPLPAGWRVRLLTGGGGGYGDPLERPPEMVKKDVQNGYISLASAERDYDVLLHSSNLEIDEEATHRVRSEHRKERQK